MAATCFGYGCKHRIKKHKQTDLKIYLLLFVFGIFMYASRRSYASIIRTVSAHAYAREKKAIRYLLTGKNITDG